MSNSSEEKQLSKYIASHDPYLSKEADDPKNGKGWAQIYVRLQW